MKAIPIIHGKGRSHAFMVSARVTAARSQVVFCVSAGLSRKLKLAPGRVALTVESGCLVIDTAPPEDSPSTFALFREGRGDTKALAVSKTALPAFGSHRWVDPIVRGKRIFLPLSKETIARWAKGKK